MSRYREGIWFIFGEHPVTGLVDVSNGDYDVLEGIAKPLAERIIEEHNKALFSSEDYYLRWIESIKETK